MLSPVHGCLRRVQAEVPLTQFVQISRASYHTAAADVTLHLDVIGTIGEHKPIQEQKLKQSAVSSPLGRCIIVPPLVLVVVNLTATTPLLRFLIATGVAEETTVLITGACGWCYGYSRSANRAKSGTAARRSFGGFFFIFGLPGDTWLRLAVWLIVGFL